MFSFSVVSKSFCTCPCSCRHVPCLSRFCILYLFACVYCIAFTSLSIMAVKLHRSLDSTQVITQIVYVGRHPPSKTPVGVLSWTCRSGGKDRADRLAGRVTLTSGLHLGRSEVLRSLRHYLGPTKRRTSHHRSPGGERR